MRLIKKVVCTILAISCVSSLLLGNAEAATIREEYTGVMAETEVIATAEQIIGGKVIVDAPLVFIESAIDASILNVDKIQSFIDCVKAGDKSIPQTTKYSISDIKQVFDFSGNQYYVVECTPSGYFIYSPRVDEFLEFSLLCDSPYLGYNEYLYWAGPVQSYVFRDAKYWNTVTETCVENSEDLAQLICGSKVLGEQIFGTYDEQNDNELQTATLSVAATEDTTFSEKLVKGANVFVQLKTREQIGYFVVNNGCCGYIAAGMLLLYYDWCASDGFVKDNFDLHPVGDAFVGSGFSKSLYTQYGNGQNNTAAVAIGNIRGIDDVIYEYALNRPNLDITCATTVGRQAEYIISTLKATKRPMIVFGTVPKIDSVGTMNHALIAYGYTSHNQIITHYGHANKNKIYLSPDSIVVGSTYRISSYASSDTASQFTDVGFSWGRKPINRSIDYGIMQGTSSTKWSPDAEFNRAMMVTVLYRLAGSPSVSGSIPFTDVPTTSYYYNAVKWAYKNGITYGTSSTEFSPFTTVTRTQTMVMLYRYANKYNYYIATSPIEEEAYPDLSTFTGEKRNAWLWGLETGIVDGMLEGTFYYLNGSNELTRIQAAKFINSLQCLAGKWMP